MFVVTRLKITEATVGLGWLYGRWVWQFDPLTYSNWGAPFTTPRGNIWYGLVTTENGGNWMYDSVETKHALICQSLEGEIQHTVLLYRGYSIV